MTAKTPSLTIPSLTDFRRIVVKVGSSLIVDASASRVNEDWLASLTEDIAWLHGGKRDVLVVSSGALAPRHHGRPGAGDAAGHRGAATLSQRALDHRAAARMARGAGDQRERHG